MSLFIKDRKGNTTTQLSPVPITLATFVKNEEHCLEHMFKSVVPFVKEIVLVDTGSTDKTIEIAKDYNARVYEVGFTDFGKIRTLTMHLASNPFVLMLDADETLTRGEKLQETIQLLQDDSVPGRGRPHAFALPRKRWLDLEMTQQTEIEAYPDWQVRLMLNRREFIFRRALHEEFHGGHVTHVENGPVINHFQDVFKDEKANQIRKDLYKRLAPLAGVKIQGGKAIE